MTHLKEFLAVRFTDPVGLVILQPYLIVILINLLNLLYKIEINDY